MRIIRPIAGMLAALTLGATLTSCYAHEDWEYDREHRLYNHRHWREEEVYRREDGRWYARRHGTWFAVEVGP